jgi:GNAT superfamily N-acetyltransferase
VPGKALSRPLHHSLPHTLTRPIWRTGRKTPLTHERPVLLVHPPFISPAAPPATMAAAAARLRGAGAAVRIYDANSDFFLNHLLHHQFLENCGALACERKERGEFQGLDDPLLLTQIQGLSQDSSQGQDRWAGLSQAIAVLQGEDFYEPEAFLGARRGIDAALALASLAFYPLRLHWSGLHHPGMGDWDVALAYARDPANPFHRLSSSLLDAAQDAQALVFCLQSPDQLLPALALHEFVSDQHPDLAVILWGPGLKAPAPPPGVAWLAGDDPAALCAALQKEDPGPRQPDYTGLKPCLAPEALPGGVQHYSLQQAPGLDALKEYQAAGGQVLRWSIGADIDFKQLDSALRLASKAGMWNQVELPTLDDEKGRVLATWCAANPNLAHSVKKAAPKGNGFSGPRPAPLTPEPMVGPLPPMPGRPLWRWLEQESHLAPYVRRHGVRQTRTCRIREDGTAFQLGEGVEYHFVHFPDLNEWHIENILALITSAGKVKPDWLRYNLEHSYLVAYVLEEGVMVATETLKHPRPEYVQKVRERTGLDFNNYLERGYIVVRPEYRGLGVGDTLVRGCLARAQGYKTYLAIAAENKIAQEMTARHGSRYITSYYSEEVGKEVEIWAPQDQNESPLKSEAKCK